MNDIQRGPWRLSAVMFCAIILFSGADAQLGWTVRQSRLKESLYCVVGAAGQFVAAGESGLIITSQDGKAWTSRLWNQPYTLTSITWGDGKYLAVGTGGAVFTSTDGVEWTQRSNEIGMKLNSVIWGDSQFVAVGDNGIIQTSPSGSSWTGRFTGTTQSFNSIAWTGTQFVAVGGLDGESNTIFTSPDAITWTNRFQKIALRDIFAVTWTGEQLVAVGENIIATSPDGIAWERRSYPGGTTLRSVSWNGTQLVAVGDRDILSSNDGISWAGKSSQFLLRGVSWMNGIYVAVGDSTFGRLNREMEGIVLTGEEAPLPILSNSGMGRGLSLRSHGNFIDVVLPQKSRGAKITAHIFSLNGGKPGNRQPISRVDWNGSLAVGHLTSGNYALEINDGKTRWRQGFTLAR